MIQLLVLLVLLVGVPLALWVLDRHTARTQPGWSFPTREG